MSEPDASTLLSVSEAIARIDATPVSPRVIRVALADSQGLRLAAEVRADRDYPPFDKSLMDGFAVRCEDVKHTPVDLHCVGEIAAGQRTGGPLRAGEAIAIMTGAPLPEGADGVVPVEETMRLENAHVRILRADGCDRFIAKRGFDCAAGAVVLPRGTKLEAAQLAVAGSTGAAQIDVFAAPRVAMLSTGDELVPIDATPGPAQIRNSNNIMLVALLRRLGCDVHDIGTVRDDYALIRQTIASAMQSHDALFVTGGMSMGQYDFVPKVLLELGVDLKITKLRIKPGKPFVFGTKGPSFVFGLPGNPVSSFVCAVRLCSGLMLRMAGSQELERCRPATLASPLEANGPREFYQPAVVEGSTVRPLKWKGSADIYTLAQANCLIIRAENAPALLAGASVDVLEIPT